MSILIVLVCIAILVLLITQFKINAFLAFLIISILASVLFVLSELLESGEPRSGDWGLMMAMGPGFCAELVLLRW